MFSPCGGRGPLLRPVQGGRSNSGSSRGENMQGCEGSRSSQSLEGRDEATWGPPEIKEGDQGFAFSMLYRKKSERLRIWISTWPWQPSSSPKAWGGFGRHPPLYSECRKGVLFKARERECSEGDSKAKWASSAMKCETARERFPSP